MDVRLFKKRLPHRRVSGKMGKESQLDLGIVRVNQHVVLVFRDKILPQFSAHLHPDRDILQIRIVRGQSSCRGSGLIQFRVDPVVRVRQSRERFSVGPAQLGNLAVRKNVGHDLMIRKEPFQCLRVGGISGFRLASCRERQFLKQHFPQLLRRIDIEFVTRLHPDRGGKGIFRRLESFGIGDDPVRIDLEADVLHIGKDRCQRQFNLPEHTLHTGLGEPCGEDFMQFSDRPDRLRAVERIRQRQCLFADQSLDGIAAPTGVEKICRKHRIKRTRVGHAPAFLDETFDIVADKRLGKKRGKRIGSRVHSENARAVPDPQSGAVEIEYWGIQPT